MKGQNSFDEGNGREIEIERINLHDAIWEKLKVAAERKIYTDFAEAKIPAFIDYLGTVVEQVSI